MTQTHTQGQWNYYLDGDCTYKVNAGLVDAICDCVNTSDAQNEANAKLIATAPELLQFAEWVIDEIENTPDQLSDALLGLIKIKAAKLIKQATI